MVCFVNLSVRARGVYEIKRQYQNANHLRQNQKYREKFFPEDVSEKGARILYGDQLATELNVHMDWEVP